METLVHDWDNSLLDGTRVDQRRTHINESLHSGVFVEGSFEDEGSVVCYDVSEPERVKLLYPFGPLFLFLLLLLVLLGWTLVVLEPFACWRVGLLLALVRRTLH